jgi:hypothetical protein
VETGKYFFAPTVGSVTIHQITRYGVTACAVRRARDLFQVAPRLGEQTWSHEVQLFKLTLPMFNLRARSLQQVGYP